MGIEINESMSHLVAIAQKGWEKTTQKQSFRDEMGLLLDEQRGDEQQIRHEILTALLILNDS